MGNIQKHFKKELEILQSCTDGELLINPYIKDIKKIIKTFEKQGHSGASAAYTASYLSDVIKKILMFDVISPLTGEDDEWFDVSDMPGEYMLQNKRNSAVFKRKDGCTFNDMIVWKSIKPYDTFTGTVQGIHGGRILFNKFPIVPKTFYIDVHKVPGKCGVDDSYLEDDCGRYEIDSGQQEKLKEIQEYYDLGDYFISL